MCYLTKKSKISAKEAERRGILSLNRQAREIARVFRVVNKLTRRILRMQRLARESIEIVNQIRLNSEHWHITHRLHQPEIASTVRVIRVIDVQRLGTIVADRHTQTSNNVHESSWEHPERETTHAGSKSASYQTTHGITVIDQSTQTDTNH